MNILNKSLENKKSVLDSKFDSYFSDVKQANGQPLNDKRNGQATLDRWDRKSDSIRRQQSEIEKTERAIEREQAKIDSVEWWYIKMPQYLTDLIDNGTVKQWRKHPRFLFVNGVEKARLVFHDETGLITCKYADRIPDQEQYAIFRDVFNALNQHQKAKV